MLLGTALLALIGSWLVSRAWIALMRKTRLGQPIRPYGPDLHSHKRGTPTMGGVAFVAVLLGFALWHPTGTFWPVWLSTLAYAGIGLLDDGLKLTRRGSEGLGPGGKLLLQLAVGTALFSSFHAGNPHALDLPGRDTPLTLQGWPLLLWYLLVFAGTANAFNLTDGLDGLAAGVALIALVPLGLIAAWQGHAELVVLIVAFGAGVVGFLSFNRHPARLFMGDTGAFALGTFVAAVAFALGAELYLLLFALVPVLETLSVVLQVGAFRLARRRVFKVAPLHHHFEAARGVDYPYLLPAAEWPETRVTLMLWLWSGLGALAGLGLYVR